MPVAARLTGRTLPPPPSARDRTPVPSARCGRPVRSTAASTGRAGHRCRRPRRRRAAALDRSSPPCPAAARPGRARSRWPRPSGAAIADERPPGRAGRHRHRQDPRLPRAGHPVAARRSWWPPPPRRCRTSWPARTSRSSPSTSTVPFDVRRAEGPVQLRLPPAAARGRRAATPRAALDGSSELAPSAPRSVERLADVGRRRRATGDRAELDVEPSARGVGGGQRRPPRSAPARPRCPRGEHVLRRGRPAPRPPRPTSSWSTPTSTASTSQPAARCCPSTTWS